MGGGRGQFHNYERPCGLKYNGRVPRCGTISIEWSCSGFLGGGVYTVRKRVVIGG